VNDRGGAGEGLFACGSHPRRARALHKGKERRVSRWPTCGDNAGFKCRRDARMSRTSKRTSSHSTTVPVIWKKGRPTLVSAQRTGTRREGARAKAGRGARAGIQTAENSRQFCGDLRMRSASGTRTRVGKQVCARLDYTLGPAEKRRTVERVTDLGLCATKVRRERRAIAGAWFECCRARSGRRTRRGNGTSSRGARCSP